MTKISYKRLNKSDIPSLIKTIKKIKLETKSHDDNLTRLSSWNKKYKLLPSKKTHVYLAKKKHEIIGYYHVPTYDFFISKKKYKIGSIQDVAVLKKYRKKNIFKKLSNFAIINSSKYLDLMYTFPNKKSIHTFLKYEKFSYLATLPFYIHSINSINLLKSKFNFFGLKLIAILVDFYFNLFSSKISKNEKIIFINKIDKNVLDLFNKFSKKHKIHLKRNFQFLNWRYNRFKNSPYKIIALKKENKLMALVIIKIDKIFGCNGVIVMDFAYTELYYFKKVLLSIKTLKISNLKNISFILLSALTIEVKKFGKIGFLKIPSFFVPRNLDLLFRSKSKFINNFLKYKRSWLVTLSDWDVF